MTTTQTSDESSRLMAIALRRLQNLERAKCFDPFHLSTRPTEQQDGILKDINTARHRYVLGGNQSGKTQLGARECSWVYTETHPYWKRPAAWGNEPLTMMIVCRTTAQAREIWTKKVRPFLSPDEYKEYQQGNILERVENPKNGNTILFFSHHAPDEAREKVQSYVAHWVWLDEMPKSWGLLEELHKRTMSKSAPFLSTFTPKAVNTKIRQHIEAESPIHRRYKLHTLANPIFADPAKQAEIEIEHKNYSKEMRQTVLFGDWYGGERAVYDFQPSRDIAKPEGWHPSWRHIEVVDPAASGKAGLMLLAESPRTWQWYVVLADYVEGNAATELIAEIEKRTRGYNVMRRVCDPHEAWYMKEAAKQGRVYQGVFKKNERKKDLIKAVQENLLKSLVKVAPWCDDLVDEFNTCQWSETVADKIVGASRFHLLDCLQYGLDNLPKPDKTIVPVTFDQALKEANRKRKKAEAERAQKKGTMHARIVAKGGKRWRR